MNRSSLNREKIIEILERNSGEIRGFGVEELQLFGSYAKNAQDEESDVDLLVTFGEKRGGFDDFIGLKRFLEDLLDEDVDLVKKDKVREELRDSILRGERVGAKI